LAISIYLRGAVPLSMKQSEPETWRLGEEFLRAIGAVSLLHVSTPPLN
jgi:hypothetical protein